MTILVMDRVGVICVNCDRPIPRGRRYSWDPVSVGPDPTEDQVICEVICLHGRCAPIAKGDYRSGDLA